MMAADVMKFKPQSLVFCTWHDAPEWARLQLRSWVAGMRREPDSEVGEGAEGAAAWLKEKISLSRPGGLFQTFMAIHRDEVVWTGSVVHDDRNVGAELAEMGHPADAFLGLFNTRYDIRGRGIGWAGANYVDRHVWAGNHGRQYLRVALFTANPAAERHYRALGYEFIRTLYIPAFGKVERLYMKSGAVATAT